MDEQIAKEEQCVTSISEEYEVTCWGCGLRLILASYSPVFKCGWCGAVTKSDQSERKPDSVCFSHWRRVRDRFFVSILLVFILFVIGAGVWAVFPVVFSVSNFCGLFHCAVTAILSIITISTFCMASFRSPGTPSNILWGSYPVVGKNWLNNYTFCVYCSKPKPPRAHHCRSCQMCVMDMDHHCPFIGNCVGSANHLSFVSFLISVVVSCLYVTIMTVYVCFLVFPPLDLDQSALTTLYSTRILKELFSSLASSVLMLSLRGFILLYLAFASLSVEIGIGVLLWQQLLYIYDGNTYLSSISSGSGVLYTERGWKNIARFFGCPWSVSRFVFLGRVSASKLQDGDSSYKIL